MKYFLLFFLLASPALAAVDYELVSVQFKFDSQYGTMTVNSRTVGYLTGGKYAIKATDDQTGDACMFVDSIEITPRNSIPSVAVIRDAIRQDAIDKGIRDKVLDCMARKAAEGRRDQETSANVLPGLEGEPIVVP